MAIRLWETFNLYLFLFMHGNEKRVDKCRIVDTNEGSIQILHLMFPSVHIYLHYSFKHFLETCVVYLFRTDQVAIFCVYSIIFKRLKIHKKKYIRNT